MPDSGFFCGCLFLVWGGVWVLLDQCFVEGHKRWETPLVGGTGCRGLSACRCCAPVPWSEYGYGRTVNLPG